MKNRGKVIIAILLATVVLGCVSVAKDSILMFCTVSATSLLTMAVCAYLDITNETARKWFNKTKLW